ncbi:MAG TPA: TaqI-like C-terminal specificity domain-containing protein [Pedobacter sp.]|nr:TaqI-like C-terminal specificity domain-containing protein [Pedobacter sp.]
MSDYVRQFGSSSIFATAASWVVLSDIEQRIKTKIEAVGTPLKDWDINIYRGILTGYNEAFIIDGKKKDELISQDPKSAEIIRPILRGRDIKRYTYEFADLWLINAHNGIREKGLEPINIIHYPAVKDHLDKYYWELEKRADKGVTPYNLRNCAYMDDFNRQKIGWGNLALNSQFTLIESGYLINAPSAFFCTEDLYLLAILNSTLSSYYIKSLGVSRNGGYFEFKPMFVEQFPIPKISEIQKEEFIQLAIQIQNSNSVAQIKELEIKLNSITYKLYHLNDEEIKFIENTPTE